MAIQLTGLGLDCRSCPPQSKIERGCEEDSPISGYGKFDEFEVSRCPVKLITMQSVRMLEAFSFYEKGYLPNSGGWMDQPEKLLEAIAVIETELNRIRKNKEKEANAH
ncbi:MAG: hypothetical protein NTY47_01695 [Candidatus Omnitrophica bacterium]|nr:hypothetical protein [Candidatus Omnitrophota bacterium]